MNHSFNIKVAKKVGIEAAIILNNIAYWVHYKKASNLDEWCGYYWVYMSAEGFKKYFDYMTIKVIRDNLKKLEDNGLIMSEIIQSMNFNSFDRTKSYTLTEKAEKLLEIDLKSETKRELEPEKLKEISETLRNIKVVKSY